MSISLDVSDEELEEIVVGTPPNRIVIEELNVSAAEMDTLNFEAPAENSTISIADIATEVEKTQLPRLKMLASHLLEMKSVQSKFIFIFRSFIKFKK
jgi:hypothetical protein